MEIPLIDFGKLDGEQRHETMSLLHHACEKWGIFQVENHGIDKQLMEKVKQLVNAHYEEKMKNSFYESDIAKSLENKGISDSIDWESAFYIWHRSDNHTNDTSNISEELRQTMDEYVDQVKKVAENLSELMCENLGLEKNYIKETFSGNKGPSVGTKVAKYPKCPRPDLVKGLREHTDAGAIILMLQDDQVSGLEFLKDGRWVEVPPSKNNTIYINTGDQVEVLSNGQYKSALHRVMTDKNGSRLSIATFYNPAGEAVMSPAPKLVYPNNFRFQDYLKLYSTTKFTDKGHRIETMKKMANGH